MMKTAKMYGYLEKRGKMTIRGRWKRWWCVLEGHLLLYYKSQTEYLKQLSPCCGSLNMALVRSIQPNIGCLLHVVTHSQLVILRAPNKEKQQEWFHELVTVLPHSDYRGPIQSDYFSFISHELQQKFEDTKNEIFTNDYKKIEDCCPRKRQIISPINEKENGCIRLPEIDDHDENNEVQTSTGIFRNDIGILTEIQNNKIYQLLEKKYVQNCDNNLVSFNSENEIIRTQTNNIKIRKYASYLSVNKLSSEEQLELKRRSSSCECIFVSIKEYDSFVEKQSVKSNPDDCEILIKTIHSPSIKQNLPRKISRKQSRGTSQKSGSFCFFKKLLSKRKHECKREEADNHYSKPAQDVSEYESAQMANVPLSVVNEKKQEPGQIITNSSEPRQDALSYPTKNGLDSHEMFTTINETNNGTKSEESDSWTMVSYSKFSQSNDKLPELPVKMKINHPSYNLRKDETNLVTNKNSEGNVELDTLLLQLSVLNEKSNNAEDPDYDTPISHSSLINKIVTENILTNNKEFLEGTNENMNNLRFSTEMAPDSLEMPWLTNNRMGSINYWSTANDYHFCLEHDSESDNDELYQDSLNPIKHCL